MQGWFKLHRELFESELWNDVSTFRLFLYLISQASHKDGIKIKGIELKRGQYIRSYRKLAEDLSYKEGRGFKKYSLSTIKSSVNKLVSAERVNVKETELGTLFTILNYSKYQDSEEVEKESLNALNELVRTNSELTPNEVRTNPEQEQELKNLRTKELSNTTTTTGDGFGNVFQAFEENLCKLSPMQRDSLSMWYDDFNQNKEIILEAVKIADDRNRKNFGFVEYLFKEWANNKLTTVEQIQTHERNKFNSQKRTQRYGKTPREELVPDWFDKQKHQKPKQPNPEIEREREKLLRELRGDKANENCANIT